MRFYTFRCLCIRVHMLAISQIHANSSAYLYRH